MKPEKRKGGRGAGAPGRIGGKKRKTDCKEGKKAKDSHRLWREGGEEGKEKDGMMGAKTKGGDLAPIPLEEEGGGVKGGCGKKGGGVRQLLVTGTWRETTANKCKQKGKWSLRKKPIE